MSLTTAFPFQAYIGDLKTRKTLEHKLGVSLSLLTSEDMQRMAFVEVKVRCGQEDRVCPWLPVRKSSGLTSRAVHGGLASDELQATFYDTRMGNFDVRSFPTQSCTTCANTQNTKFGNERCQGHFGYISMPRRWPGDPARVFEKIHVINPHLSAEVEQLLQAECFFCHRLRCPEFDVQRFIQALRLVDAGLLGEALRFLSVVSNARGQELRNHRRRDANEEVINSVQGMEAYVERILAQSAGRTTQRARAGERGASAAEEEEEEEREDAEGLFRKPATDVRNDICKQAMAEFREYSNVCTHCQGISPRITTKNGHLFFLFQKKYAEFNVAKQLLTQAQLREWEHTNQLQRRTRSYFATATVREHIKRLCLQESAILGVLFPQLGEATLRMRFDCPLPPPLMYKVFFLDKMLVPPLPLRLSSGIQVSKSGHISPDEQTRALSDVLGFVEQIETYYVLKNNSTAEKSLISPAQEIAHEHNLRNLQAKVTEVYTDIMESFAKKEGLFRMHMMGKRVNQACRSVISPDYMLEPNEVLLPRPFARGLTFPEQVSPHSPARQALLKRCVINGPRVYPGATHLEVRLPTGETRFVDLNVGEQTRRQHATKYFAMAQAGTLIVHRHILDGDRCIFNRQPTLHKVSMMAYRARVLSGLKTLRFHYVNGKSYNADFDGDEMNIHVPQSVEARAELECLMDANLNYLAPTAGKPIRGLIQDHVVAGVLLTLRDKFIDRDTFVQYVYSGVGPYMTLHQRSGLSAYTTLTELIPVPAILKPRPLWTGKQLISVLVRYVTSVVCCDARRKGALSAGAASSAAPTSTASVLASARRNVGVGLRGTSLIQPSAYTTTDLATGQLHYASRETMNDDRVLFQNSELITGVLCKNQLGPSNLSVAHVIHEVYGPHMVGELFGALGRVLTQSLQREGFSMGMDDMCLVQETRRDKLLRELDNAPLHLPDDEAQVMPVIMGLATKLQKEFIPGRMLMPFPRNQLLAMTMSGAKGSNTNTVQMALGLGQQLFDGRRVARMNSGKTLPAFFVGEKRARSLGYALGRFASGIRPPEYTIHAMAGRDGIIDTAVKTSRSGHLQRCLIKGLESLVVHWDHSVRDANGSVVQFLYGGDGLDPIKASTLTAWEMAKDNAVDLCSKYGVESGAEGGDVDDAASGAAGRSSAHEGAGVMKRPRPDEEAEALLAQQRAMVDAEVSRDPLPPHMSQGLVNYLHSKASFPLFKKVSQVRRWNKEGNTIDKLREKRQENIDYYTAVLRDLTAHKRTRAYCDAGEPVGLLAAQAAGEPSTQMTLNTFHSAGSTVTHVTEGIPRLRELLIYASVKKAAVIIPVEKAQVEDERAIARLVKAGVATKLADCLAIASTGASAGRPPSGGHESYHFHVERGDGGCLLTVALLFSHRKLQQKQEELCMSRAEHLDSFTRALRAFSKQVISTLDGRQERASGATAAAAAAVDGIVMDPAQMDDAANDDDDDEADDKDDEDERSTAAGTPAISPTPIVSAAKRARAGKPRSGRHASTQERGAGDDDDASIAPLQLDEERRDGGSASDRGTSSSDEDEESVKGSGRGAAPRRAAQKGDDDDDDEDEEEAAAFGTTRRPATAAAAAAAGTAASAAAFEHYDSFQAIQSAYRNKKYVVSIVPMSAKAATAAGVAALPDDLFLVNVSIRTPSDMVAVIPDVVAAALHQQTFPTWMPQFDSVAFTRSADDATSGEIVFQGANATLREVAAFVSLFTVRGGSAVKLHRARSTDIQDVCASLGVESGYRCLYDELDKLFRRYAVDYHHLTLIADAATHRGRWENFNFTGVISQSASPLFQMTFASSKRFLHTALTRGIGDELSSISAAIMVGERPKVGTACVKVAQDTHVLRDVIERNFA